MKILDKSKRIIEEHLKSLKLRYFYDVDLLEFNLGSEDGFIEFDYDEITLNIRMHSANSSYGVSQYDECYNCYKLGDIILTDDELSDILISGIDELCNTIRINIRAISQIENHINKIIDIVNERNLELDMFITINYDFENLNELDN